MTLFELPDGPAAPDGPLVRVRMTVAYDGSGFHGFAPNPGVETVGGTLAAALERVLRAPIQLTCAGRTDTGVHAWGQVVSFDAPADRFDPLLLQRSVNRLCGPRIVAREVARAPDDFDARRSAVSRTYRYTVLNRPVPDPFLAHLSWHVDEPLDLDLLRLGCDPFVGEHDFSAFCRRPRRDGTPASLVRRCCRPAGGLGDGVLRFEIRPAPSNTDIRSIVGTLVDVGARRHPGEVPASWPPRPSRHAAAAQGLCCGGQVPGGALRPVGP